MLEANPQLVEPAPKTKLCCISGLPRLHLRYAALEAEAHVRHPAEGIEIVLAGDRIVHANELVDDPVPLHQQQIEADELLARPVEHEDGALAQPRHNLGKVMGREL